MSVTSVLAAGVFSAPGVDEDVDAGVEPDGRQLDTPIIPIPAAVTAAPFRKSLRVIFVLNLTSNKIFDRVPDPETLFPYKKTTIHGWKNSCYNNHNHQMKKAQCFCVIRQGIVAPYWFIMECS
jgi:hypothetical protein